MASHVTHLKYWLSLIIHYTGMFFSYEDAKEKMAQWIDFYNNGRIHGELLYLTLADYFEGRKESRLAERREKLHTADIKRKAYWLQQQQA